MIARTRKKIIVVTMLSAVLVLAALVGVINWLNFAETDESAEILLEFLVENEGNFPVASAEVSQEIIVSEEPAASGEPSDEPSVEPNGGMAAAEQTASGELAETEAAVTSVEADPLPPVATVAPTLAPEEDAVELQERRKGALMPPRGGDDHYTERVIREIFTYETPYETRYFSVWLGEDGSVMSADISQIAAVTETEAENMALRLCAAGKTEGYHGNYKFLSRTDAEGTLYVFLDCTKDINSIKRFLNTSILVSLAAVAVLLVLVIFFSDWAIKPMVAAYDKQKSFITNAGHELKTPLAVIGSCTEVLELEQGTSKWTDGIRSQVRRMGELTQNLIALARLDEGAKLPMAEFDLSGAAVEEWEMFLPMAQQRELLIRTQVQEGVSFCGNESAIRHLIIILADNAVKYASGGEIVFRLERRGKRIVMETENWAEGFQTGEQPQLFERFYRGDASHSQEKGGYGVGLSIAEAIVKAHGGRIIARSEEENRLCITVSL